LRYWQTLTQLDAKRPKVVIERTYRARVKELWELWTMHDEEFTKMSTMGFTSQLTKLDTRFAARTR